MFDVDDSAVISIDYYYIKKKQLKKCQGFLKQKIQMFCIQKKLKSIFFN